MHLHTELFPWWLEGASAMLTPQVQIALEAEERKP
jgi:hypothetical protein